MSEDTDIWTCNAHYRGRLHVHIMMSTLPGSVLSASPFCVLGTRMLNVIDVHSSAPELRGFSLHLAKTVRDFEAV